MNMFNNGDVKMRLEYNGDERTLVVCMNEARVKVADVALGSVVKLDNGTCYVGLA